MVIKYKYQLKTEATWSDANQKMLALDTGSWRTERPVLDKALCNYCGLCSLYCPPQCMKDKNDHYEVDLAFCKGCGICAHECPKKALSMKPEGDFTHEG
jgi:pyruvate ferredoxin oxidoreductase delta subunit